MRVGQIASLPMPGSQYATVRDEYGNNRTTDASQLEEGAQVEDDFAYRVDFFKSGALTLKSYEQEE